VLQYIQINREMLNPLNSNWLFIKPTKINRGVLLSAGAAGS
jgi:hypothetical protein